MGWPEAAKLTQWSRFRHEPAKSLRVVFVWGIMATRSNQTGATDSVNQSLEESGFQPAAVEPEAELVRVLLQIEVRIRRSMYEAVC